MLKKLPSLKKVARTTALATLIGLAVASAGLTAVKYSTMTSAGSPGAASSYASTAIETVSEGSERTPLEQFIEATSIHRFLPIAAMNANRELTSEEADLAQPVGRAGIEQMVNEALPYIAREFGTGQVSRPLMTTANLPESLQSGFFYLGGVHISDEMLPKAAKRAAAHEYGHAQWLQRSFAPWSMPKRLLELVFRHNFATQLNETFTELVEWEVLANQALDGDVLAKAALLEGIKDASEIMQRGETGDKLTKGEVRYSQKPMRIVLEVLAGKRTSYAGVELDGLANLLRQEIAQAREFPITPNATASDLSNYCELPTTELYCAPSPLDVRIEGSSVGDLDVFFYRNAFSSGNSSYRYIPAGQPYTWTRFLHSGQVRNEDGVTQLPVEVWLPKIAKPSKLILKDNQGVTLEVKLRPADSNKHYFITKGGQLLPVRGFLYDTLRELQGRQQ